MRPPSQQPNLPPIDERTALKAVTAQDVDGVAMLFLRRDEW
jgi:hypothetical protein